MMDFILLVLIVCICFVAWGNGIHFSVKVNDKVHRIDIEATKDGK